MDDLLALLETGSDVDESELSLGNDESDAEPRCRTGGAGDIAHAGKSKAALVSKNQPVVDENAMAPAVAKAANIRRGENQLADAAAPRTKPKPLLSANKVPVRATQVSPSHARPQPKPSASLHAMENPIEAARSRKVQAMSTAFRERTAATSVSNGGNAMEPLPFAHQLNVGSAAHGDGADADIVERYSRLRIAYGRSGGGTA